MWQVKLKEERFRKTESSKEKKEKVYKWDEKSVSLIVSSHTILASQDTLSSKHWHLLTFMSRLNQHMY